MANGAPLTLESLTGGEPRPVGISELETQLSELWRSAAAGEGTTAPVTRACALTLFIYVESPEAARKVTGIVAEVTRQNPCRAILLIAQPNEQPPGVSAWISAHCHLPVAGEKQVCSEQITIQARGAAVANLPHVVLPLTISGLPTYFWWRSGGFDAPESFDQILRVTNRVLIDSGRFTRPDQDFARLAARLRELPSDLSVSDLNWSRLTPWRELIAQCFDSPRTRPYLDQLREVRIEFERQSVRRETQHAQALLLVGWLAGRLGWQSAGRASEDGGQTQVFRFKSAGSEPRAVIVPCAIKGSGSGVCFSLRLETGAPAAVFSISRGLDGRSAETRAEVPGQPPIQRTVRLEVLEEVEIVNRELMVAGRDHIYEEALAKLAEMLRT